MSTALLPLALSNWSWRVGGLENGRTGEIFDCSNSYLFLQITRLSVDVRLSLLVQGVTWAFVDPNQGVSVMFRKFRNSSNSVVTSFSHNVLASPSLAITLRDEMPTLINSNRTTTFSSLDLIQNFREGCLSFTATLFTSTGISSTFTFF